MVERGKLDQALLKIHGLTDLWRLFGDAPASDMNLKLVCAVFGADVDLERWRVGRDLARRLEALMAKNEDPPQLAES